MMTNYLCHVIRTWIIAAAALLTGAAVAFAGQINTGSGGLAIKGYDPVAYFSGAPEMGSPSFTASHGGATYRFSSDANKAAFLRNPKKYTPEYGGWCAYGLSQGYKAPIDPQAWTIHGGKLYLNYSKGIRATWNKDRSGYISKANGNWPAVKNQ